jgi:hypothetical protein
MSKGSRARPFSVSRNEFENNWDQIFRKKEIKMQVKVKEGSIGMCPCGRSPIGKCVGWHNLNEEQLAKARADYAAREAKKPA